MDNVDKKFYQVKNGIESIFTWYFNRSEFDEKINRLPQGDPRKLKIKKTEDFYNAILNECKIAPADIDALLEGLIRYGALTTEEKEFNIHFAELMNLPEPDQNDYIISMIMNKYFELSTGMTLFDMDKHFDSLKEDNETKNYLIGRRGR